MTPKYKILKSAGYRIDDIFSYTLKMWGHEQANTYVKGLFDCFNKIATHRVQWRKIPSEYGVKGYYTFYKAHIIFWSELPSGAVGIFSILNQSMNIPRHLQSDSKAE